MPIDAEGFERRDPEESIEDRVLELLYGNPETAYNSREIAVEVMDDGLSVQDPDQPEAGEEFTAEFVDVATVTSILDALVDDHNIDRRVVEVGNVERSHYRAPSALSDGEDAE